MNSIDPQLPATKQAGDAQSGTIIGIHCALPLMPTLDLSMVVHSPSMFMFAAASLKFALSRADLLESDQILDGESALGAAGAFHEGLMLFTSPRRNEAVQLVQDYFREAFPFLWAELPDAIEIAYVHDTEGAWYPVQPTANAKPFARWLTPEFQAERARMCAERDQNMLLFMRTMVRPFPDAAPVPPNDPA